MLIGLDTLRYTREILFKAYIIMCTICILLKYFALFINVCFFTNFSLSKSLVFFVTISKSTYKKQYNRFTIFFFFYTRFIKRVSYIHKNIIGSTFEKIPRSHTYWPTVTVRIWMNNNGTYEISSHTFTFVMYSDNIEFASHCYKWGTICFASHQKSRKTMVIRKWETNANTKSRNFSTEIFTVYLVAYENCHLLRTVRAWKDHLFIASNLIVEIVLHW